MPDFWPRDRNQSTALELGGGRVMIVDDDAQVCVYVALLLRRLGFESSANTDPLEALDTLLDTPTAFRILPTDQRTPELSGLDLINKLSASHPDFPVVLMSGYGWGIAPSALPGVGFLSKPFEIDDREKAIRYALKGD
ncbi:MAG: response regulator [Gemmatimonadota bacterium]|nr:response regulator [Gemmatimonadota bacterium]